MLEEVFQQASEAVPQTTHEALLQPELEAALQPALRATRLEAATQVLARRQWQTAGRE